jgi:carotenoid cleavage dioxygenase-like enzyme
MRIFQAERRMGKTETLVAWAKQSPSRIIVVADERERERLVRTYELRPEQVRHWNSNAPRSGGYEVAIDNLDLILQHVYGDVKIVTVTKDA